MLARALSPMPEGSTTNPETFRRKLENLLAQQGLSRREALAILSAGGSILSPTPGGSIAVTGSALGASPRGRPAAPWGASRALQDEFYAATEVRACTVPRRRWGSKVSL